MLFRKVLLFITILLSPIFLLAQKGWSISPILHTGTITKHTKKLTIDNRGISEGLSINCQYQTYGTKRWHQEQHFPQPGIELAFFRMSNNQQLGNAIGLLPNITLHIINQKNWKLRTTLGMGIAWLSKHYDPFTNPQHNAIGSHINNYTSFRFFAEKSWAPQWKWTAGVSFTHFSNGTSQLPNYGLNIPALALGVNYAPQPIKKADYIFSPEKMEYRKWGFFAEASAARQEYIVPNGPKYLIYNLALAATFHESAVQHSFLGVEYEYSYSVYNFFKFLEQYNEEETKNTGKRLMVFGGHELSYGPVDFGVQVGVYIGPNKYLIPNTFYNKINLRYHFLPFGKKGLKTFLALHMKAHLIDAEYISAGIGVQL